MRYERIAILNALGAYFSYLGKIETKQKEKEDHFILATKYYNKASRIDMHEPSTWVGKGKHNQNLQVNFYKCTRSHKNLEHTHLVTGQLLLAKGDVDQAFSAFKIVLDGDRDNVPALLGHVYSYYNVLYTFVFW